MADAGTSEENEMVQLKSKQEEIFEVNKTVASRSITVKNMVEDTGSNAPIPLPMVDSKILIKVIEYCKYHHESETNNVADEEMATWDKDFVKVDDETLFNLILVGLDLLHPVSFLPFGQHIRALESCLPMITRQLHGICKLLHV